VPRPPLYTTRAELGWPPCPASYANPRDGLCVHYDSVDQNLAEKPHAACVAYWQATRRFHTGPSRGWTCIGYSWMACPHGHVLEGRGLFKQQAAQPGGNSTFYSVTLATGPTDEITPAQINAVRQLREWLMEPDTSISGTVKGHRDFIATSCPGDDAYALVRNGAFAAPPTTDTPSGDDMPKHWRYEKDDYQALPDGEWATLRCTRRGSQTGELYSWLGVEEKDGAYFSATAAVRVADLAPGAEVQGQFFEVARGADGTWQWVAGYPVQSGAHVAGAAHFAFPQNGNLGKGRRLRLRVIQYGGGSSAVVDDARVDVLFWDR
jgi:hypothetical protein